MAYIARSRSVGIGMQRPRFQRRENENEKEERERFSEVGPQALGTAPLLQQSRHDFQVLHE
jgi:hypothetical protein